jgi:hypothetical protein
MNKGHHKTDNRSLGSKIALRRWLLDKMGITDDVRVLDTCAGAGLVWSAMEEHCTIKRWTRTDIKPRKDAKLTLRMEAAVAIRSLPIHEFNVVDIDPYGEPFDAYRALLLRIRKPTAVFLTHGQQSLRVLSSISHSTLEAIGLPTAWVGPIRGMTGMLDYVKDLCLSQTWSYADVKHAGMIYHRTGGCDVHYYGFALEPYPEPVTPISPLTQKRSVTV